MSHGQTVGVDFTSTGTDDVLRFGGALNLDVSGFVSVSGNFGFQKTRETKAGVTTSRLLVGVSELNAFFGDAGSAGDDTGVRVTDGTLGLLVNKTGNAAATYALDASGSAALVGISGLTLGGSVEIRKNTTGPEVKQTTIATPGDDVTFSFSSSEGSLQSVGGALTLDVTDFVSVKGNFGFQKTSETKAGVTTSRLLVGVSELNAFFGDAGPTGMPAMTPGCVSPMARWDCW